MELIKRYYLNKYLKYGLNLGDSVSYSFIGEISGYDKMIKHFLNLEAKIINYGYIPHSFESFISLGGYGRDLPELKKGDLITALKIRQENIMILDQSKILQKQSLFLDLL